MWHACVHTHVNIYMLWECYASFLFLQVYQQTSSSGLHVSHCFVSLSSDLPTIFVHLTDLDALYGDNFSIECPVNPDARTAIHDLSFSWYFTPVDSTDSIQLSHDLNPRISIDPDSGTLTIADVTLDDGGQYRCNASNEAGSDSQLFSLEVQSKCLQVTLVEVQKLISPCT